MYKTLNRKGFTIIELLVGLSIGIIVLTGLLSFFFRTSKMINAEQTSAANLSQLQFVMNKIIQDVKEANTVLPGTGSAVSEANWSQLPHLPYGRTYSPTIIDPTDDIQRIAPAYPLAYNFPGQAGLTGLPCSWYPKGWGGRVGTDTTICFKMDANYPESNSLVFYKVEGGNVIRVRYSLENDPKDPFTVDSLKVKRIMKRKQIGITSTSTNFEATNILTTEEVVLSKVKALQFTYPNLSKRLDSDGTNPDSVLWSALSGITGALSYKVHEQNKLMNPYRDTIGIKIITARDEQISNYRASGLELYTEVNIRN